MIPNQSAKNLLNFIDDSPSPFHAVSVVEDRLKANGFVPLREEDKWPDKLPEKFYVVRHGTTLGAFVLPSSFSINEGFLLLGAHTDSPCLRLRDGGSFRAQGYGQWGVEVYGGVLHHTWLDIDLGIAGRLVVRQDNQLKNILVKSDTPVMRVPNLAIHLNREVNQNFSVNPQTELVPIITLQEDISHSLLEMLCEPHKISAKDVVSTELMCYNHQPSAFWGTQQEFIAASRLDNLAMCDAGLCGLVSSLESDIQKVRGLFLFDHEECGSQSAQGANSNFIPSLLERIREICGASQSDLHQALAQSFFISADMAHAVHPNYASKHDPRYLPQVNQGPVIKANHNMRYASNASTVASFIELCESADVPYQRFINRADLGCGSTIGPMTAAKLGMQTLDVGSAQWAMHSSRESAGSRDPQYMNQIFTQYFSWGVSTIA